MPTVTAVPQGRYGRLLPFAALLVTMVSVQFGAAFSKQLFPVLGVERATFVRLGLGALLLAPVLKPWNLRVPRQHWPLLLLYSAVLGAMNLCFYLAVARIPLGIAVALEFIGPLGLAICLSHRRRDLLWVALAIFGLSLLLPVAQVFHRGAQPLNGVGVLFGLLAAGCWAAYSLLARRIGSNQGNRIIALAMPIAALLVLPAAVLQPGTILITPHLAVGALVMALFSSALPFSLEMIALTGMPIRVYGTFTSLEPALGTLMGLIVLAELPSAGQLVGIAAIIAASLGTAIYTTSSH
jgi:inner membrane transporter RhtA